MGDDSAPSEPKLLHLPEPLRSEIRDRMRPDYWQNPNPRKDGSTLSPNRPSSKDQGPAKITLRLPRRLHAAAAATAAHNGVSLNTLIVVALTEAVAEEPQTLP